MEGCLVRVLAVLAILATVSALPACGEEEQAKVDPRFASADAIVEYYNSLMTKFPPDIAAVNAMTYAENAKQEKLKRVAANMVPMMDLVVAMHEEFGWEPSRSTEFQMPANATLEPQKAASITERGDQRCVAQYEDAMGTARQLHLVKLDGRWWVSGYTMEYQPEMEEVTNADLGLADGMMDAMADAVRDVTARVRSGEITTEAGVNQAIQQAVMRNMQQPPR